ncbi:MAG: FG-GAP-like repeat-containing protein [Vicinamibacterales bacterium]
MPSMRRQRRRAVTSAAAWLMAALGAAALLTLDRQTSPSIGASASQSRPAPAGPDDEQQARTTCGGCHAFPPPEILPRDAWRNELVRMMFIRENRLPPIGPPDRVYRTVQLPPDMEQVLAFYTSRAPERLPVPEPWPDASESPVRFARRGLTMPDMPGTPAVSNVRLVDVDGDNHLDVLGTDMRQGVVFTARPANADSALSIVASIPHPAHVTMTDVDKDGVQDLLVGDMGEFFPADHTRGAVIWLRGLANGKFGALWLDGWPRVADVEAADFNGDGRNDLAVAAFGWRKTGHVSILENRTTIGSQPDFTDHTIDKRPGGIRIIPADLNADGKMDFVTLLAQEHETVLAYINKGTGDFSFDQKVIYAAPHPNWGSSGIQLVDLDGDKDRDVLLTHGDTFDDGIVKPYHGIQWLENTGGYPFVEHTLARMPGVHGAAAADLDGDGDLDVVAGALLAGGSDVDEKRLPALVWLEQTKPGAFARHTIEMGFPRHATLDVGDIDGDGDIDIVVGNFSIEKSAAAWVDVWTNERKK